MQMRHRSPLLLSGVRMGLTIVDGDDIQLLLLASAVDAVRTADRVRIVLALILLVRASRRSRRCHRRCLRVASRCPQARICATSRAACRRGCRWRCRPARRRRKQT
jgi:hypothetical protein